MCHICQFCNKKSHWIGLMSSFSSLCWSVFLNESHWKGRKVSHNNKLGILVLLLLTFEAMCEFTYSVMTWMMICLSLSFSVMVFAQHTGSGQHLDFTQLVAVTSHLPGQKFLLRETERERESDLTERIFWEHMPIYSRLIRCIVSFLTDRLQREVVA